jgi:hypothetical protein
MSEKSKGIYLKVNYNTNEALDKIEQVQKLMSQAANIINSMTGFGSVVDVDVEED